MPLHLFFCTPFTWHPFCSLFDWFALKHQHVLLSISRNYFWWGLGRYSHSMPVSHLSSKDYSGPEALTSHSVSKQNLKKQKKNLPKRWSQTWVCSCVYRTESQGFWRGSHSWVSNRRSNTKEQPGDQKYESLLSHQLCKEAHPGKTIGV